MWLWIQQTIPLIVHLRNTWHEKTAHSTWCHPIHLFLYFKITNLILKVHSRTLNVVICISSLFGPTKADTENEYSAQDCKLSNWTVIVVMVLLKLSSESALFTILQWYCSMTLCLLPHGTSSHTKLAESVVMSVFRTLDGAAEGTGDIRIRHTTK